jgi:hypothetical protein
VYLVIFALLSAVGAWIAWRRNPLYSTRSTLRSASVVLLAIAAVIGVIAAAVNIYVISASIDERQPRSLIFNFEKVMPNPYAGTQVIPIQQSVLIPAGTESDIARLQKELTARCPKARIVLC